MQWTCLAVRQLLMLASFTVIKGMEHTIRPDTLKFANEPNSTIYVRNSSPFLVPCEATGEEPLEIDWRNESVLNSRVVINTTNKGLWFMRGVQPLRSPKVHRVGIFRCMATNTAGVVMTKKFVLNFIYLQNISVYLSSPVFFNNTVRLKCSVETNQPVTYVWFKNNITLDTSRDSRLEVLPSGVLRIRDYRISDNGNYSCRAENAYKAINSREVNVVGQTTSKTSVRIYPEQNVQTVVGQLLVIECIQNGPQKSSVTWIKVTELGTRTIVNRTDSANLIVDLVQKADAGEYRCRATGGEEKKIFVSVGAPPSFTESLPARTIQTERERLIIKCNVSGQPTPSVTWYKDSQALAEDSRIHFYGNGSKFHELVVENVTKYDKGVYQCEIENTYGSSIQQTIVAIKYRKDPPYDVQGHAISSSRVNITWKIPPGYKTVYFAVHVFDFVKKTDYQEVTSNYASYFVLKDLRPYTKYAIYVQMYGDKRARGKSEAFWVQTLETKPTGEPNEIKLTSYSYGTLDVTWLPPYKISRHGEIIGYEIVYFAKGGSKSNSLAVTKNVYCTTLKNLVEGKEYIVKIAAKTKIGQGPFSKETSRVVSRKSIGAVFPAPLVEIRNLNNDNRSIVVSVSPPYNVDVKRYHMVYKFMGEYMTAETLVIKNETRFQYTLAKVESNLEYVITVTAFDSKMRSSRPLIKVVPASVPILANRTMVILKNFSLPYMKITCEPILNSTAIAVAWEQTTGGYELEFIVTFNKTGFQPNPEKAIRTKYFNATLYGVLPGNDYEVQIMTRLWRSSTICTVPSKAPKTPPSEITCKIEDHLIKVEWQPPTKSNGEIRTYHVMWLDMENKRRIEEKQQITTFTIDDFKRDSKFKVRLSAFNSAGKSPSGYCEIDTSKIPVVTGKGDGSDGRDASDIEKGIIIGCIISVFVLFVLVVFVCWSGCRRHKKRAQARENQTPYNSSRIISQYPDTISTEVSEQSTKHHQLLKKFIDEETSKESDRGLGMTPKSSRLYLDNEKIPFLPRAVNEDGSVDTSCDSQDSGVQGVGKKLSPALVTVKVAEKTPLQSEEFVAETIF